MTNVEQCQVQSTVPQITHLHPQLSSYQIINTYLQINMLAFNSYSSLMLPPSGVNTVTKKHNSNH